MSWKDIIKRGKSYGRRKKIAERNTPIQKLIQELEKEYEDVHNELISWTTSTVRDMYGPHKQMAKIKELQKETRQRHDCFANHTLP